MKKECKKHGLVEHVKEPRGYYRCKKCRSQAVTDARRKRKQNLVKLAGGKCEKCGYSKCTAALQFHHKDPKQKKFGISAEGITRSLEEQKSEIKKCILLCANCHFEIHHESSDSHI